MISQEFGKEGDHDEKIDLDKVERDFAFFVQNDYPPGEPKEQGNSQVNAATTAADFAMVLSSPISGTISSDLNHVKNVHTSVK